MRAQLRMASCLIGVLAVVQFVGAQRRDAAAGGNQAAPQRSDRSADGSLIGWLRQVYAGPRDNIVRLAERMPEDGYGIRAGAGSQGRTFGQYVGHVSNLGYIWCSQAKGEKNPNDGNDLEKLIAKSDLVKALHDAFAYCDTAYNTLTDAAGSEVIDMTLENGTPARSQRIGVLMLNYGHVNEVYGDLNTLNRIKNP